MKIIFLFKITFIILITSGCKKTKKDHNSDNGLPPATQNGQGVFACRLNGQPWISGRGAINKNAGLRNDTLFAFGTSGDENYFERLSLEINGNVKSGMIYQTSNNGCSFRLSSNKNCAGYTNVVNMMASSGNVQLTKADQNQKIISGTFTCTIPIPGCDTLNYIDGRFDIHY